MNLKEFKDKYIKLGKVEFHSFGNTAFNQCVDLANAYIKEVLGLTPIIGTNACDFVTKFTKGEFTYVKNTPKGFPNAGDVVVWNNKVGGGAGHIAIALEGCSESILKTLDQNWSVPERITEEIHNYNNVLGWLVPIKPVEVEKVAFTALDIDTVIESTFNLKDFKRYDKHWTYGDLVNDWKSLNSELDKQKDLYDEETKNLIEEKKVLSEKIEGLAQDLNARNSYINELEAKIERLNTIINTQPTSAKGELNSKDIIKWIKNTGWYAVLPLVITYLTILQTNVPKEYAVIAVPLIATGIDFIKKLLAENK